jgi:hypothetical protein
MSGDVTGSDPADMLELAERERRRTARAIEPDARLIYGVWGVAWLVGNLLMWSAAHGGVTWGLAGPVFAVLLVAAMVTTMVHVGRRVAGVRGLSSRQGAMHGWTWFLGFSALTLVMAGVIRAGASDELIGLLWSVLAGLVVGLAYLAGGTMWQDRTQFGLGVWILVSSAAGSLAGYPGVYLAMGLCGGGGFLIAAAYLIVRSRRSWA